jgi:CspA family cold shock protein
MLRGTVKWFNDARGYGFIARENGEEVYVHHTVIEGPGYRTLHEGEQVEFEARQGERGLEAAHVVKV